jgi:PAS domain S-box-containing protein
MKGGDSKRKADLNENTVFLNSNLGVNVRAQEPRYLQLLQRIPVAIYTCDEAGYISFYNEAAAALWGRRPETGKDQWCGAVRNYRADGRALLPGETPVALTLQYHEGTSSEELIIERPDGTRRIVIPHTQLMYDASGKVEGVVNTVVDITSYERALKDSKGLYRQLIENLSAAVYTCDAEGRVLLYNEAAAALWGRKPEVGTDLWCGSWKIYRPDGSPLPLDECPMAVALKKGAPVYGEEIIVERPDGVRLTVLPPPPPVFDST